VDRSSLRLLSESHADHPRLVSAGPPGDISVPHCILSSSGKLSIVTTQMGSCRLGCGQLPSVHCTVAQQPVCSYARHPLHAAATRVIKISLITVCTATTMWMHHLHHTGNLVPMTEPCLSLTVQRLDSTARDTQTVHGLSNCFLTQVPVLSSWQNWSMLLEFLPARQPSTSWNHPTACCRPMPELNLSVYSTLNPVWGRAFPRIQVSMPWVGREQAAHWTHEQRSSNGFDGSASVP
jgi:hypothetical protein